MNSFNKNILLMAFQRKKHSLNQVIMRYSLGLKKDEYMLEHYKKEAPTFGISAKGFLFCRKNKLFFNDL